MPSRWLIGVRRNVSRPYWQERSYAAYTIVGSVSYHYHSCRKTSGFVPLGITALHRHSKSDCLEHRRPPTFKQRSASHSRSSIRILNPVAITSAASVLIGNNLFNSLAYQPSVSTRLDISDESTVLPPQHPSSAPTSSAGPRRRSKSCQQRDPYTLRCRTQSTPVPYQKINSRRCAGPVVKMSWKRSARGRPKLFVDGLQAKMQRTRTKVSLTAMEQAGIPTDTSVVLFDVEAWLAQARGYPESTDWWKTDRENFDTRSMSGHPSLLSSSSV